MNGPAATRAIPRRHSMDTMRSNSEHGILLLFWAGLVWPASAQAEDPARVTIIHGALASYRQSVNAAVDVLQAAGHVVTTIEHTRHVDSTALAERITSSRPDVIMTAGRKATEWGIEDTFDVPIVFFMVPNIADAPFAAPDGPLRRRVCGVTSDIDPDMLLNWIQQLAPSVDHVAVPHSPATRATAQRLQEAGVRKGIRITPIAARRSAFPETLKQLEASDCRGVLMVLDAGVYNSPTIRTLLVWAARSKTPVWAFSERVVSAGAFAGQYFDPAALGRQAARMARRVLSGEAVGEIEVEYVDEPAQALNEHTAEMIGLHPRANALGTRTIRVGEE